MADITMCSGAIQRQDYDVPCPFREDCYRYLAPVNEHRQSYFIKAPYDPERDFCESYWDYVPRPA